jgi:hypothetical protein
MPRNSSKAGRRRRTRKVKGGFYSFSGAVGTGAPNWTRGTEVPTPDYVSKGGRRRRSGRKTRKHRGGFDEDPRPVSKDPADTDPEKEGEDPTLPGGRRRRRSGRKTRKTRKHRGGGTFGATSASYQGTGARGIADYVATDTKGPYTNGGAAKGAFNDFGAKPNSSF